MGDPEFSEVFCNLTVNLKRGPRPWTSALIRIASVFVFATGFRPARTDLRNSLPVNNFKRIKSCWKMRYISNDRWERSAWLWCQRSRQPTFCLFFFTECLIYVEFGAFGYIDFHLLLFRRTMKGVTFLEGSRALQNLDDQSTRYNDGISQLTRCKENDELFVTSTSVASSRPNRPNFMAKTFSSTGMTSTRNLSLYRWISLLAKATATAWKALGR